MQRFYNWTITISKLASQVNSECNTSSILCQYQSLTKQDIYIYIKKKKGQPSSRNQLTSFNHPHPNMPRTFNISPKWSLCTSIKLTSLIQNNWCSFMPPYGSVRATWYWAPQVVLQCYIPQNQRVKKTSKPNVSPLLPKRLLHSNDGFAKGLSIEDFKKFPWQHHFQTGPPSSWVSLDRLTFIEPTIFEAV